MISFSHSIPSGTVSSSRTQKKCACVCVGGGGFIIESTVSNYVSSLYFKTDPFFQIIHFVTHQLVVRVI